MNVCRLTQKYQTTVPKEVREFLNLHKGDDIIFDIKKKNCQVIIKKAMPLDIEFARSLESTLEEWNSDNDQEAYGDL